MNPLRPAALRWRAWRPASAGGHHGALEHGPVEQSRRRHRRRNGRRQGERAGAHEGRLFGRARRAPAGAARRHRQGSRGHGWAGARGADGRRRSGLRPGPVRPGQGDLRPARPPVQQRRHGRSRNPHGGAVLRAVEEGRRREPHGLVPVRSSSDPDDEGAEPARRADHQQRVSPNRSRSTAVRSTSPAARSTSATPRPTWRGA